MTEETIIKLKAYQIAILIIMMGLGLLASFLFFQSRTQMWETRLQNIELGRPVYTHQYATDVVAVSFLPLFFFGLLIWVLYHHFKTGGKPDDEGHAQKVFNGSTGGEQILDKAN